MHILWVDRAFCGIAVFCLKRSWKGLLAVTAMKIATLFQALLPCSARLSRSERQAAQPPQRKKWSVMEQRHDGQIKYQPQALEASPMNQDCKFSINLFMPTFNKRRRGNRTPAVRL